MIGEENPENELKAWNLPPSMSGLSAAAASVSAVVIVAREVVFFRNAVLAIAIPFNCAAVAIIINKHKRTCNQQPLNLSEWLPQNIKQNQILIHTISLNQNLRKMK